eukprot:gene7870-10684_t
MYPLFKERATDFKEQTKEVYEELIEECFTPLTHSSALLQHLKHWRQYVHIPYFPSFHKPGWLLRILVGPYNFDLFEQCFMDFWAGVTVAMTLIPQALSYAQLANLPPINGLYTAILPFAGYIFFGSSMQLCVGPVALMSLLMGELIVKYNIDYVNYPEEAVNFAQCAAIAAGTIMTVLSILNLGNFIRFIAHPVMSGFTTGAAMLIGLNQLKSAFGFSVTVPQQGQTGIHFNYQVYNWFIRNWDGKYHYTVTQIAKSKTSAFKNGHSYRNHYATAICFGLYVPLLLIQIFKANLKISEKSKKTWAYRAFNIITGLTPLVAIIIGAHVAYEIKKNDHFSSKTESHEYYANTLKIVGIVAPGTNFIRMPEFKVDFGKLLADVIPITLIGFMESYSVAHRIATQKNELHLLSASQELWANGVANLLSGISSSYPVAGSFSRSSLNAAAGAKTPLSKATTLIVVVLALQYFTRTFQYIPQAALAAVIFVAIYNLIAISDFWEAWKHSKKDFITMIVTWVIVFVFDTAYGLAAGIAVSVLWVFIDMAFNSQNAPLIIEPETEKSYNNYSGSVREYSNANMSGDCISIIENINNNSDIRIISLRQDMNFLTAGRFVDQFVSLTLLKDKRQDTTKMNQNDKIFYIISSTFDKYFLPDVTTGVDKLPLAIGVDMEGVRVIDITALITFHETVKRAREKGIKVFFYNETISISTSMIKFGIKNDRSTNDVYFDKYLLKSKLKLLPYNKAVEENGNGEYDGNNGDEIEMVEVKPDIENSSRDDSLEGKNNDYIAVPLNV